MVTVLEYVTVTLITHHAPVTLYIDFFLTIFHFFWGGGGGISGANELAPSNKYYTNNPLYPSKKWREFVFSLKNDILWILCIFPVENCAAMI